MGLSASQARKALNISQQNDVEYQGQQINQQRKALSDQSNALMTSLLDMAVPTPPSVTDYQKTVYKGTLGATKYTVDSKDIVPKADNKYSITLGMQGYGDTVSMSTGYASLAEGVGQIKCNELAGIEIGIVKMDASDGLTTNQKTSDNTPVTSFGAQITDLKSAYESSGTVIAMKNDGFYYTVSPREAISYTQSEDGEYQVNVFCGEEVTDKNNVKYSDPAPVPTGRTQPVLQEDGTTKDEPTYYSEKNTETRYLKNENATVPTEFKSNEQLVAGSIKEYVPEKYELKGDFSALYKQGDATKLYLRQSGESQKAVTKDSINKIYVADGDTVKIANSSDFGGSSADGKYYLLKSGVTYYTSDGGGDLTKSITGSTNVTVNGKTVVTFEKLEEAGVDADTVAKYKQAIAQSGLSDNDGRALDWTQFYVVINGDGKNASFVLKDDVNDGNTNCEMYDYSPNTEIEIRSTMDECLLTFDASNGRITSISYPNRAADGTVTYTTIKMEAAVEKDEIAYNEAYSKYEYDKVLYDKAQNEINKKTSIIQAQDKSLELKLKRLEDDRKELTTEGEAIDKVIQENIESSYKTFSG